MGTSFVVDLVPSAAPDAAADTALADAVELIAGTLGAYPDHLDVGGELHVTMRRHDDTAADPGWPAVTAEHLADGIVVRCGSSTVTVDHRSSTAVLDLADSFLGIADAVRLFAEAAFTSVHVAARRLHAVHSALVVHEGVGMLLRGSSGAGKSTITYACLRRGMSMASDDWVYARAGRPVDEVAGYPWRMMLTAPAAARFPELSDIELVPHTSAEGWKVPVVPPAERRHVTHAIDAVVLLDPDPDLQMRRVDGAEARQRFWDASLPIEGDRLDAEWVDDLLARPTYVLQRGPSPDAAAAAIAQLAHELARTPATTASEVP
jgi:hypothetical protein